MNDMQTEKLTLLKNELKYLLQLFPDGVRFFELATNYEKFYGKNLNPKSFNCNNFLMLFHELTDVLYIDKCRSVRLNDCFKGILKEKLLFKESKTYLAPFIPGSVQKNDYYECKIYQIYDISKFWIVIKPKELYVFQQHLNRKYSKPENLIQMPKSQMQLGKQCLVREINSYYRGIFNNILLLNSKKVRIFCVDYGRIINVPVEDVFYLNEFVATVPRFAIRANLAYIQPIRNGQSWSPANVNHFKKLINKCNLFAKICEIETSRCVLHVAIRELCGHYRNYLNDVLIAEKMAKRCECIKKNDLHSKDNCKLNVKYAHLFPLFEMIEGGVVPATLDEYATVKLEGNVGKLIKKYFERVNEIVL